MIGSSLPLCYPQIGTPNLFFPRTHVPCLPLDKTYPTGGSRRVFKHFAWLGVGSVKAELSHPAHQRVPITCSVKGLEGKSLKFLFGGMLRHTHQHFVLLWVAKQILF